MKRTKQKENATKKFIASERFEINIISNCRLILIVIGDFAQHEKKVKLSTVKHVTEKKIGKL